MFFILYLTIFFFDNRMVSDDYLNLFPPYIVCMYVYCKVNFFTVHLIKVLYIENIDYLLVSIDFK